MVKILFFGDFLAQDIKQVSISRELESYVRTSDCCVCNFEAPVEGDGQAFPRCGPRLCQAKEAPAFLEKHGFNVIQLANNHMLDFGDDACAATISAFSYAKLLGAGSFDEAYEVKVICVKEKMIGFLSCVHHEFGVWENSDSVNKCGTAWINHPIINHKIKEAKERVDFLFVLPHAGIELIDVPLPEWREKYKDFIDWGADAVIGTHPHVPQGWEEYKGKPIFYSLGNLYFDAIKNENIYWNKSLCVEIDIIGDEMKYKVENIQFVDKLISIDYSIQIKQHNRVICDLLYDQVKYDIYLNENLKRLWKDYYVYLIRGLGAISLKLDFIEFLKGVYCMLFRRPASSLLINSFQCESHRNAILRILNMLEDK